MVTTSKCSHTWTTEDSDAFFKSKRVVRLNAKQLNVQTLTAANKQHIVYLCSSSDSD